jgi:Phage Tail Collar Domain
MKSAKRLARKSAKSMPSKSKRAAKPATRKTARKKSALGAPGPTPPAAPVVGQVALFAFPFTPAGWLPCDGRMMSIMQNQQLFSLLGTSYGGNGETDFALPKLNPASSAGPGYFIAVQGSYPTR